MKNNKFDFILTLFTDLDNDLRPVFKRPFLNEEMVYATDAHSIVRLDKKIPLQDYSVNDDYPDIKVPDAKSLFEKLGITEFKKIKTSEFIESFYDSKLQLDALKEACEKCDGEGDQECECCGGVSECKSCDGSGIGSTTPISRVKLSGNDIMFMGKKFQPYLLYRVVHSALILGIEHFECGYADGKSNVLFNVGELEIIIMARV